MNSSLRYKRYQHRFFEGDDWLALVGDGTNIQEVRLVRGAETLPPDWQLSADYQPELCAALDQYFDRGTPLPKRTNLPSGGDFRKACWRVMSAIPFGRTISYGELAERAGSAGAIRAAGSACATNPLPLFIPCHRVLKKDGTVGGFAWGAHYKEKLLALEGIQSPGS